MRIMLLIDWFIYYAVELANAMAETQEVMLITRDHNFEFSSEEDPLSLDEFLKITLDQRVIHERLRYPRGSPRNLSEIMRVNRAIQSFDPHVVHLQQTTDWRLFLLFSIFRERETVLTVHDVRRHRGEEAGWQGIVERLNKRTAKKIIVHGQRLKEELQNTAKKRRIGVIPLGALHIYKKWDAGDTFEKEKTLLFFGRLSKYKGIEVLLQAQPLIMKALPEARMVIAGRDSSAGSYRKIIDARRNILFYDKFISNREVPRLFRQSSVAVLPYTEASQSAVIGLAYAFGKPVVVTRVGSLPEMVEHGKTGLIIPPHDPEALTDAVVTILKDKDLQTRMGECAYRKACTELSWKTIAEKTLGFYRENGP